MNINKVSTESTPSVFSRSAAESRVATHLGHSIKIIEHLETQHKDIQAANGDVASQIYDSANDAIKNIQSELKDKLSKLGDEKGNLSQKDIKTFAKLLHKAEKESAKVIQKTQNDFRAHLSDITHHKAIIGTSEEAQKKVSDFQENIQALTKGGVKGKIVKLLSTISKSHAAAVAHFKGATILMERAAARALEKIQTTTDASSVDDVNKVKLYQARHNQIEHRTGVIGIGEMYSIGVAFDLKTIQKQTKSFIAQRLSTETIRDPIVRQVSIPKGEPVKSSLIPLNGSFDKEHELPGADQSAKGVFGRIFGKSGGISSANRQEAHLINGWETKLENAQGKEVYRAIRHAITSDKFQKDPVLRAANSKQAAQELLTAVLVQELSAKGISLEEAANGSRIPISFTSVSLVTPDDLRTIGSKGANEKNMLRDQLKALKGFEGDHYIQIGNHHIPVNFSINTFNFGVNAGAVDFGLGTINQYDENVKGLKGLADEVAKFKIAGNVDPKMQSVLEDIQYLMRDRKAYLEGGNQFEVGAKILLLQNMMREANGGQGAWCAFNCMSGKDRTGIMDAIAKTFALMADENGGILPTHKELESNISTRQRFQELAVPMLLESGNLEITQTNTGVMGYKVSKHALVGGISEDVFLSMIGLSKTTSS